MVRSIAGGVVVMMSCDALEPAERDRIVAGAAVVVIGAGPAGLAMALELAERGLPVVVLDSGPIGGSRRAERLSVGEHAGALRAPLHELRKRGVGGTSRAWASNLARLEPDDFEVRPWIGDSGWPIGATALEPFVERALRRLGCGVSLGGLGDRERAWCNEVALFAAGRLEVRALAATSTGDVGRRWRTELKSAAALTVLADIHVIGIVTDASGQRVVGIDTVTSGGDSCRMPVARLVLAAGGVEVPRLLLASVQPAHPDGLGNHSGHLGRWYQDHPFAWAGVVETEPGADLSPLYFPAGSQRGPEAVGPLMMEPSSVIRSDHLTRVGVFVLEGRPWMAGEAFHGAANSAIRRFKRAARAGHVPVELGSQLVEVVRGAGSLIRLQTEQRCPPPGHHVIRLQVEPTPRADSTVTLTNRRDRFGVPMARIDWRLGELERLSTQRMIDRFDTELRETGLGRLHAGPTRSDGWPATIEVGYHPSGTTRMSDDPGNGVVDRYGKVHGVENLWVNSSSVFPTIGYANPTLTVVALGIRLAERLHSGIG